MSENTKKLEIEDYKLDNLINILNKLKDKRVLNGTIKPTENNPESSRGHLFLIFKITNKENINLNSYLSVVDMAGVENPNIIFDKLEPETLTADEDPFSKVALYNFSNASYKCIVEGLMKPLSNIIFI